MASVARSRSLSPPIASLCISPRRFKWRCMREGKRALFMLPRVQLIAPDGNLTPLPGGVHDLLKRALAAPVLERVSGRPVPDERDGFSVVIKQNLAQAGAHALHDHQQALPTRKRLCDAPGKLRP